jgi:soluble lytic murein transglycosylase
MPLRAALYPGLIAMAVTVTLCGGEASRADPDAAHITAPAPVPEEAVIALRQGRFFHASRILAHHIETQGDTTRETLLLAARAAAGWGDWERIEQLLAGREWLEEESDALGWQLLGRARLAREEWPSAAGAFQFYLAAAENASDRDRGLAYTRRAMALREIPDAPAALAAFDSAAQRIERLDSWLQLMAADVAAEDGDTVAVETRLARVDTVLAREWGWRARVTALQHADAPARALAVAESAALKLAGGSRRAQAWSLAASIHAGAGDTARARTAYRRALDAAPGTSAGLEAARALAEFPTLTAAERLAIGRTWLRHGNYTRGVRDIEAWLDARAGTARERERVRMELAHALFRGARYDDAEKYFLAVVPGASAPAVAAEALFYAGRSQYRDGRTAEGRRTFLRVTQRWPRQDYAVRALYFMADLDHDDGHIERATDRYRRAAASRSGIDEVGLARMRLGGIAFLAGEYAQASREFEAYRRAYPGGRRWGQATYWAARSNQQLGRDTLYRARLEEVRRAEPLSYYGGRAAERLGVDLLDFPMQPAPPVDEAAMHDVDEALQTYDLLRELSRDDAAAFELDRVRARFGRLDNTAYALAEALATRGAGVQAISIGWDLQSRARGWNDRLLRIIYPFPFRLLVEAEAREKNISPFLAAGLIRQESMFQPGASSGAGAIGLMQVLPETGEILARARGVPRFRAELLRQPEINVLLGTSYLADQLVRHDGRLSAVLSAYNAGPHRITRWSDYPEFEADDELFTERIPFAETRDYVKIVQQNVQIYQALWGRTENGESASGYADPGRRD